MESYIKLLQLFGVRSDIKENLSTTSYVSMDNIHDAIIDTGVNMDKPFNFYVVAAKQAAIDEYRKNIRRTKLRIDKAYLLQTCDENWNWDEYGFSQTEIDIVKEWIGGITLEKSKFTKRERGKHRLAIKRKMLRYLMDDLN